ncbi:hypothetical protein [Deinococcus koreensis]|uniref:Uncharacterized protein n=1 Tax=Deinococcus koreensis TaxID=2054903 RepID=A0A2K3V1H2_9DEIO|nr:hypothetical protein [Deinococcus koreensis]PNY82642.1 hypothetical protein CVO96_15940 [Deinococcus koreensis]
MPPDSGDPGWRNEGVAHDTEDRAYWYGLGCREEADFCAGLAHLAGLQVRVNPAKARNPKVIDLIRTRPDGREGYADLKTQRTPFFTARRYGHDPALTVTFNLKDLRHYERLYPQADIIYHVCWTQTELRLRGGREVLRVPVVEGVWLTSVPQIRALVDAGRAPVHAYQHRVDDDQGNARDSYLLALGGMEELLRLH